MKTIKCPSCQSDVPTGKFCFACGAVLVSETEARILNEEELVEKIAERTKEKLMAELRPAEPPQPEPAPKPEEKPVEQPKRAGRFFGS